MEDKINMRNPKGLRHCSTEEELHQYQLSLKMKECPNCGQIGFLICHGFLRGYSTDGQEIVIRGHRYFCSDRFRKKGCGRTFSVLFPYHIRDFMVTASILWSFLIQIENGLNTKAAWETVAGGFCVESGYRILKKLHIAQSRLRLFLCKERSPPFVDFKEPLLQLAAHFRTIFPLSSCPFSSFQIHFQEPLLR